MKIDVAFKVLKIVIDRKARKRKRFTKARRGETEILEYILGQHLAI